MMIVEISEKGEVVMALEFSFNDADAARIENYAAVNKIGVFDFVRQTD